LVVAVGPIGSPLFFFIGKDGEKRKAKSSAVLMNLDALYAVHSTLMACLTPEEWHSLSEGSRVQRRPQYDSLYVSHLFISAYLLGIRPLACGLPPPLTLTFASRPPPMGLH
jgi:hypothetical protein